MFTLLQDLHKSESVTTKSVEYKSTWSDKPFYGKQDNAPVIDPPSLYEVDPTIRFNVTEPGHSTQEDLGRYYEFLKDNYTVIYSRSLVDIVLSSSICIMAYEASECGIQDQEAPLGFIAIRPQSLKILTHSIYCSENSFLCIRKDMRHTHLLRNLINYSLNYIWHLGIYQCIAVCSVDISSRVKLDSYMRNLSDIRIEPFRLKGFRRLKKDLIPQVNDIISTYISRFDVTPSKVDMTICDNLFGVMNDLDITHVIGTYRVVIGGLKTAILYYYSAPDDILSDLIHDILIIEKLSGADTFVCYNNLNNKQFLKQPFIKTTGSLYMGFYNWQCRRLAPSQIGCQFL